MCKKQNNGDPSAWEVVLTVIGFVALTWWAIWAATGYTDLTKLG